MTCKLFQFVHTPFPYLGSRFLIAGAVNQLLNTVVLNSHCTRSSNMPLLTPGCAKYK
jgi:hypothetical protein